MPLTANRDLKFFATAELIALPVDDNVRIYKGAFVGRNRTTNLARPLVAGDDFLGVAYNEADNTIAGHTAAGISVRLHQHIDINDILVGASAAEIGRPAYASDDGTMTLSPTGNSRIGRVVDSPASNEARVRCQPIATLTGVDDPDPILQLSDASQTLTLNHVNRVLLMPNSTARTLTLPPVATVRAGAWLQVVKTTAAVAAITLDGNAAETINGGATFAALDARYDSVKLICTGSEWIVVNRDVA